MIQMEATVFVNKKVELDFGTILKCAHPHRYKDESGNWQTASTDVLIRNEKKAEWAELLEVADGTRLTLAGHGKPIGYTNNEGKQLIGLQIEPHNAEIVSGGKQSDEDAPF